VESLVHTFNFNRIPLTSYLSIGRRRIMLAFIEFDEFQAGLLGPDPVSQADSKPFRHA